MVSSSIDENGPRLGCRVGDVPLMKPMLVPPSDLVGYRKHEEPRLIREVADEVIEAAQA